jgi:recombination protein RecA
MESAALRAQLESALRDRWPSPFTFRPRQAPETVSSGFVAVDSLTPAGGLPRGALTEIFGPDSSGRTSLLLSLLAQMTARQEACALVDATDAFDPLSAQAAGVDLGRLLWVRCAPKAGNRDSGLGVSRAGNVEQSLRVTELLLQGGGFGLVAVDLGDVPPLWARRVPLAFWFRFRRAVENTPTVLMVLDQAPCTQTCASLVLRLEPQAAYWSTAAGAAPLPDRASHARLLRGARLNAEVVRSRFEGQPAVRSCQLSVKNQYSELSCCSEFRHWQTEILTD